MRLRALTQNQHRGYQKVILFQTDQEETYLFVFRSALDSHGCGDRWFPTLMDAHHAALVEFGISAKDWVEISDPQPGEPHDLDPLVDASSSPAPIEIPPLGFSLLSVTDEIKNHVLELFNQGNNIQAIKFYRERMKVGLAEAKYCAEFLL